MFSSPPVSGRDFTLFPMVSCCAAKPDHLATKPHIPNASGNIYISVSILIKDREKGKNIAEFKSRKPFYSNMLRLFSRPMPEFHLNGKRWGKPENRPAHKGASIPSTR